MHIKLFVCLWRVEMTQCCTLCISSSINVCVCVCTSILKYCTQKDVPDCISRTRANMRQANLEKHLFKKTGKIHLTKFCQTDVDILRM